MPLTSGLTRGKLFSILFYSGRFTEAATYFKSHWKHCSSIESFISPNYVLRRKGSCAKSGLLRPRKHRLFLQTPSKCTANDNGVTIILTEISLWRLFKFVDHIDVDLSMWNNMFGAIAIIVVIIIIMIIIIVIIMIIIIILIIITLYSPFIK